jgi:bacillithiol biosynthesis deacetylase BshB1
MFFVDILAFGAHPDDVEIGVGGILAKHALRGCKVMICNLTQTELSSNGTIQSREMEAKKSAQILGVQQVLNLKIPDRGICDTYIDKVIEVIRQYRPRIVLAPYHKDRHPDHIACHHLVTQAVFDAALIKKRVGIEESHRVSKVYYYFLNCVDTPSFIIDVSDVYRKKIEALCAYTTQFQKKMGEVDTPLNQGDFLRRIQARDTIWGYEIGTSFGEGLFSKKTLSKSWLLSD